MGHYYQYYAQLSTDSKASHVTWVALYEDASGAGTVTTASLPVFDFSTSPPTLLAVVGIDVRADDLRLIDPAYRTKLDRVIEQSNACPAAHEDQRARLCHIRQLRQTEFKSDGTIFVNPSNAADTCSHTYTPQQLDLLATCNATSTTEDAFGCHSLPQQNLTLSHLFCSHDPDSYNYKNEACDSCATPLNTSATAGIVLSAFVVVEVIVVLAVYHRRNQKKRAYTMHNLEAAGK
eukprot:m.373562 g.373562  ORF g.373562 m.373562 type:complete len:234 (+) comp68488_c0_seq1:2-703(+)